MPAGRCYGPSTYPCFLTTRRTQLAPKRSEQARTVGSLSIDSAYAMSVIPANVLQNSANGRSTTVYGQLTPIALQWWCPLDFDHSTATRWMRCHNKFKLCVDAQFDEKRPRVLGSLTLFVVFLPHLKIFYLRFYDTGYSDTFVRLLACKRQMENRKCRASAIGSSCRLHLHSSY